MVSTDKLALKEEKQMMESTSNSVYEDIVSPNGLEHSLFSFSNEGSPDSTTKNICRICGKTLVSIYASIIDISVLY